MDEREKLKRLQAMERLADLAWAAEAARGAELRRNDAEAAGRIARLRTDRGAWDAAPAGLRPPRAEAAWQAWTDRSIAEENAARARLRAEIEARRPELARAFGRKDVLRALAEAQASRVRREFGKHR